MARRIVALGATALAVTAILAVRSADRDEARHEAVGERASHAQADSTVERLTAQLAELRTSHQQTAALVRSMQHSGEAATDDAGREPAPAPSPEEEQRIAQARMAAQTELLQDSHAQEVRDPLWAPGAVENLRKRYATELAGVTIDADCRTSLCRVDLAFPDGGLQSNSASLIAMKAPWSSQGFLHLNVATSRATFYLAKPGHELPRIPEADAASPSSH